MIPLPDPKLVRPGPWVLAENPATHTMVITTLRDWKDGKGPQPLLYDAIASWKQQRTGSGRGGVVRWLGFKAEDVAIAHHLLSLLNTHRGLVLALQAICEGGDYGESGEVAKEALSAAGFPDGLPKWWA